MLPATVSFLVREKAWKTKEAKWPEWSFNPAQAMEEIRGFIFQASVVRDAAMSQQASLENSVLTQCHTEGLHRESQAKFPLLQLTSVLLCKLPCHGLPPALWEVTGHHFKKQMGGKSPAFAQCSVQLRKVDHEAGFTLLVPILTLLIFKLLLKLCIVVTGK